MNAFDETKVSRAAAGTFAEQHHSRPELTALKPALLDTDRLTGAETRKLEEHLADPAPGTGTSNEQFYDTLTVTHLTQSIVYGRRGAPPELLWQLHVAGGEPVVVPPFVAKACTVPDLSEPAIALRHKRNRAEVAKLKATEERARRAGRTDRETYRALRAREDAASAKFLEADAAYEAALNVGGELVAADKLARWNSDELVQLRSSGYLTLA